MNIGTNTLFTGGIPHIQGHSVNARESESEKKPIEETQESKKSSEATSEESVELRQLKARDREVRRHEAAHIAAGGSVVRGGAKLEYTRGPDGVLYATGGEVSIDTSKASTPEATLTKAETIRRAALAPANPSAQDRRVAADAARMAMEARQEIFRQQQAEANGQGQQAQRGIGSYITVGTLESPEPANIDELI